MSLKLWGTRGSIPCPGPETVRYGGNTTCFEINCGDKRIIIDAGTGIRLLGKKIMLEEANLLNADLFFTHTHMDHIQGLPFFAPLYNPNSDVRLNAGHLGGEKYDLQGIIGTMLMKDPVFPVPSSLIEQACSFSDYDLMENIFASRPEDFVPYGVYTCRFYVDGEWVEVLTDTTIPCGRDDSTGYLTPCYSNGRSKDEFWIPLVEKAAIIKIGIMKPL